MKVNSDNVVGSVEAQSSRGVIIFLDVDGVLTSTRCNGFHDFDLWAVSFLRWACDVSGAKIVISSVWRNNEDAYKVFTRTFGQYLHADWRTSNIGLGREGQIDEWRNRHPEAGEVIVIDDDIGDLRRYEPVLIRTSSMDGMLWEHMDKLRAMLNIESFPHAYNPVFRDDVCFFTEREKDTIAKYTVGAKHLGNPRINFTNEVAQVKSGT
jgi:hypothetical protein